MKSCTIPLLLLFLCSASHAQSIRTERDVSLEFASQLAADAMSICSAKGFHVSVAVVDRDASPKVSQRGDEAGPHTLIVAQEKAYTSASSGVATQQFGERAQAPGGAPYLANIPGFILLGGGVPIKLGNELIGAIGVAGAPRGIDDEQCALAALEKSRDKLK